MAWILLDDNNVVAQKKYSYENGFIEVSDNICCGMVQQSDGSFINPPQNDADKIELLREERNAKLTETDWVVTMHKELGTNIPAAWKTYRQALRDITDTYTSLDDVVWPEKP